MSSPPIVLVADDDELVRGGLIASLEHAGFRCVAATNADEVCAALRRQRFDALLSDIVMPGNAHLELLERVAAIAPGLPVVLLTGSPTLETALKALRAPVAGYLVKPAEMAEVVQMLS